MAVAVIGLLGTVATPGSADRPGGRLAQAQTLVRQALALERSAVRLLQRHDGPAAVASVKSAEGRLRRAIATVKHAPLDTIDQQAITNQLVAAEQFDGEALAEGPDNALPKLQLSASYKQRALVMIRAVAHDGGRVPE